MFGARLLQLREVAASPDVILFIDELHTLVGAGAGSGPLYTRRTPNPEGTKQARSKFKQRPRGGGA